MEMEDSQNHYTEQLIQFNKLPSTIRYDDSIKENDPAVRLDKDKNLIGIVHSLFKITPGFDKILEKISIEEPNTQFILFDTPANLSIELKKRWEKTAPLTLEKSVFLPIVKYNDFIQVLYQLDLILDPFGFGAGTVFYQAMSCSIPMVTMPSNRMKTRSVLGGYKQMNITNPPIAETEEEYIEICLNLIRSRQLREHLGSEIKAKCKSRLFTHDEVNIELESFIRNAISMNRSGKKLPTDWCGINEYPK